MSRRWSIRPRAAVDPLCASHVAENRVAFETVRDELDALDPVDFIVEELDLAYAIDVASRALPAICAMRDRCFPMPYTTLTPERFDRLETYLRAAAYAHLVAVTALRDTPTDRDRVVRAARDRLAAVTLFARTYDEIRRIATFLEDGPDGNDPVAPPLRAIYGDGPYPRCAEFDSAERRRALRGRQSASATTGPAPASPAAADEPHEEAGVDATVLHTIPTDPNEIN